MSFKIRLINIKINKRIIITFLIINKDKKIKSLKKNLNNKY